MPLVVIIPLDPMMIQVMKFRLGLGIMILNNLLLEETNMYIMRKTNPLDKTLLLFF